MLAAVRLARRTRRLPVRITLVNPSDRFTERLRMHQIATGQELADHRIPEILDGTGVEFVCGWATSVDPEARLVAVDGDRVLPYDELVLHPAPVPSHRTRRGAVQGDRERLAAEDLPAQQEDDRRRAALAWWPGHPPVTNLSLDRLTRPGPPARATWGPGCPNPCSPHPISRNGPSWPTPSPPPCSWCWKP
ncbi:hypothetical protein [Nocardia amikacinitolerans]|uniref:hypothetical protein n=1 Tax=Nocardia amikacinitolerans TaxID=756689 RepID=UPI000AAF2462|nr:hypothetical protein [Nocardia amikacinitolerans]